MPSVVPVRVILILAAVLLAAAPVAVVAQQAESVPLEQSLPADPPPPPVEAAPPHATPPTEAEAQVAEPAVVGPVETTASEMGAMDVCTDMHDESALTMLERVRRNLSITACASSAWLDGLFGDQMLYEEYRETYGTLSVGSLWSEYDGFDPRLRFRVRLQLPQWDERLSAFAGRVGEDDYVSDTEGDFSALPSRQFGNLEDESVLLGLGYSNPKRTGNDFDASVGVRVDTATRSLCACTL